MRQPSLPELRMIECDMRVGKLLEIAVLVVACFGGAINLYIAIDLFLLHDFFFSALITGVAFWNAIFFDQHLTRIARLHFMQRQLRLMIQHRTEQNQGGRP